jgi:arylsulfatase
MEFKFKKLLTIKNGIIFIILSGIIVISLSYFNRYFVKTRSYNIILISIDALRADHLGCYGYYRNTSPNIDALAKDNILFKNFFTVVPKTGPSMTTFFTGKLIQNHGVVSNPLKRDPSIKNFAQLLPENYKKAAFISNASLSEERGYSDGFDEYILFKGSQEKMTPIVIKWLIENSENAKFFLWLHYIDPHGPYTPPAEFHEIFVNDQYYDISKKVALDYTPQKGFNENYVLGAVPKYQRLGDIDEVDYYIAQYDAEIKYTDSEVGKILDFLESKKLTKNTIIIITADHGESLGENHYYFEHGMLVNEGSIHIPLIISHPNVLKPLVINSLLQNTDFTPTILKEFALTYPTKIDGIDFSELYYKRKTNYQIRDFIYSCTPHEYINFFETIRTRTDKLIRKDEKVYSYYDIQNDKYETKDIFSEINKDIKKEKISMIENFGKYAVKSASKVKLPKEKLEILKSLGYIN